MEYVAPAILFVLFFVAALLATRGAAWWSRRGGSSMGLPLEKGAVRLDRVAKKRKSRRRG